MHAHATFDRLAVVGRIEDKDGLVVGNTVNLRLNGYPFAEHHGRVSRFDLRDAHSRGSRQRAPRLCQPTEAQKGALGREDAIDQKHDGDGAQDGQRPHDAASVDGCIFGDMCEVRGRLLLKSSHDEPRQGTPVGPIRQAVHQAVFQFRCRLFDPARHIDGVELPDEQREDACPKVPAGSRDQPNQRDGSSPSRKRPHPMVNGDDRQQCEEQSGDELPSGHQELEPFQFSSRLGQPALDDEVRVFDRNGSSADGHEVVSFRGAR